MKALDSLYLKDKDQLKYEAYDNFEKFIWPTHMNRSDTGCSLDISVSWAVASKTALANVSGLQS